MKRIAKLLLGAALVATLPAMASAQREQRQDQDGGQIRDRGGNGSRGFAGGRGPEAYAAAQAQRAERPDQTLRPDQAQRADRTPQDFNRDRGQDRNGQGFAQRGDGNRGNDGRGDWRNDPRNDARNDTRRLSDPRRFDDRRYDAGRGNDRRYDDRGFNGGRPGDNRWVGSNWRQDRRYDWQSYRNSNRNQFRGGRYDAPRGWNYGYRRFSVGAVLPGLLWGSGFWLNDPYQYRLPPAYGPYRWVRYYDDVLLVDTRTGRVVDAIPGFFW